MRRLTLKQNRDNKIYAVLLTALSLVSFVVILVRTSSIINEEQNDVPRVAVPQMNLYAPTENKPETKNVAPAIYANNDDDNDDDNDDEEGEEGHNTEKINNERRAAVKEAMMHAWNGYKSHAWGSDTLNPISKKGSGWLGMGTTIIDSLDTLWIMGMKKEFSEARNWVELYFNPKADGNASFSDVTTSVLGGLLSAYTLSGDDMFLNKAHELGNSLIHAFDSDNALPYSHIDLKTGTVPKRNVNSSLGEIGTVQLEFLYLSELTGNSLYEEKALSVLDTIWEENNEFGGLIPTCLNTKTGGKCNGPAKIGNDGNGYYELLLKLYLFLSKKSSSRARVYRDRFKGSMTSFTKNLIKTSTPSNLKYVARLEGDKVVHKMKYSSCLVGGMLTMAGKKLFNNDNLGYAGIGESITNTCHEFHSRVPSGIAPDTAKFSSEKDFKASAKFNLLRAETVQSYFVNWRLTHDEKYRDWGWELFQAIESKCKADCGYAVLDLVTKLKPTKIDFMPSHFLSGTLKYLYLLYSDDDMISLDDYVFNTKAHMFPINK